MNKVLYIFMSLLIFTACKEDEASLLNFSGTYFEYEYSNCDNETNPEESCIAWIRFKENNRAELLLGGDIIYQVTYSVQKDSISLVYDPPSSNTDGFEIIDESNLKRLRYDEIWVKR